MLSALVLVSIPAFAGQTRQERSTQLGHAMLGKDIPTAKRILADGLIPTVTADGVCWLHLAIALNENQLIKPLVNAGVLIECRNTGQTLLQYAVSNQRYRAAKELIGLGANVNARSTRNSEGDLISTPPLDSVVLSYLDNRVLSFDNSNSQLKSLIRLLLDYGAVPNLTDKPHGITSLALTAERGAADLTNMLVSRGGESE